MLNLPKIIVMDLRIGNGYDVHALAEGLPLWLGGVQVESPIGCIAHSDGDVAIHALCDALLGALALGDIGKHFPDTSDEFAGIDSKIPADEVIWAMKKIGDSMHSDLRETARGGLAATPTGKRLTEQVFGKTED